MAGAAPSFSDVHVARVLLVLNGGLVGRKSLVRILGVGEGSVRTIIKKLSKEGLIKSKPRGQELSRKGRRLAEAYLRRFTAPTPAELDVVPDKKCCVITVHRTSSRITTGVAEREMAVRAGADGAVLLKYEKGRLSFPCDDISWSSYPKTKKFFADQKLEDGDVVVIGFSDDKNKAADGALSVALKLTSK